VGHHTSTASGASGGAKERTNMIDTEQSLFAEYEAWRATNKLPRMLADKLSSELDYARDLTDDAREVDKIAGQLQWLADFIKRWEKVTRGAGA
jgi:hypothetical protein